MRVRRQLVAGVMVVCAIVFLFAAWPSGFPGSVVKADQPAEDLAKLSEPLNMTESATYDLTTAQTGPVLQDQSTIDASADVYIMEGEPDSRCDDNFLWTGIFTSQFGGQPGLPPVGDTRSLIQFDMTALDPNREILSATLSVYILDAIDYTGGQRSVDFWTAANPWAPESVAWANQPPMGTKIGSLSSTFYQEGMQQLHTVDVTSLVQGWASGAVPNYGIIVDMPTNTSGPARALASTESGGGPQIEVHYTSQSAAPVADVWPCSLSCRADRTAITKLGVVHVGSVVGRPYPWTVALDPATSSWLQVSPLCGASSPTRTVALDVFANPAGLVSSTYTTTLTFSTVDPDLRNTPQSVEVCLSVEDTLYTEHMPLAMSAPRNAGTLDAAALVIGISDYEHMAPIGTNSIDLDTVDGGEDLAWPHRDRTDMLAAMTAAGVPQNRMLEGVSGTEQLTSQTQMPSATGSPQRFIATKAGIIQAFSDLGEMIGHDTTVYIYFSGHGGQTLDMNQDEIDGFDEFIAPYDTDVVDDQWANIITDDELDALLNELVAGKIVVVLDSCFCGNMPNEALASSGHLRHRGLQLLESGSPIANSASASVDELIGDGRVVVTGGTGDQSTLESSLLEHGVFTHYFLQCLNDVVCDANGNGQVSVEEAFWSSKDTVADYTDELQVPDIFDYAAGQVDLVPVR